MKTKLPYILLFLMMIYLFKEGQALAITVGDVRSGEEMLFPKNMVLNENGQINTEAAFSKKVNVTDEVTYDEFPIPVKSLDPIDENTEVASTAETPGVAKAEKLAYLTFDDGPTGDTPLILDILREKQAKATFFMLEPQMKTYSDQVKRLVAEGHYPALHSVTHDKHKLYGGAPGNVAVEMEQARKTLFELTGVDSRLTRAPYGSKPYMKDEFRNELVNGGFKMWDWNIDTMDWKHQWSNPQMIVEELVSGEEAIGGGDQPLVILMHVNAGTGAVLPQIIDYLAAQGYSFAAYNPEEHFSMNFWKDERL